MKTALRILSAPVLTLALAGPARADAVPCEGMLSCLAMIPVGAAYVGFLRLKPTPTLIQALQAVSGNDNAGLKRLIASHPDLVHLTSAQSGMLAEMEAGADPYRVRNAFVLARTKGYSTPIALIDSGIHRRDWPALEWDLKINPDLAAAVDGGYVLLREAAQSGNLDALRLLLEAGVRADTHKSGALLVARDDDVRQLLAKHGATAPAAAPTRKDTPAAAGPDYPPRTPDARPAD